MKSELPRHNNRDNETEDGHRTPTELKFADSRHLINAAGTLLLLHAMLAAIIQILRFAAPGEFAEFLSIGITGFTASAILMQGLCILLPLVYVLIHFKIPASVVPGISSTSGGWIIMSATIGIPAAIVFTGFNNVYVYILTRFGVSLPAIGVVSWDITYGPKYFLVPLLLSVLLPGIVEELMFRGVIQGSIESGGGKVTAVVIPAITFAVFHVNIMFVIAPLLAGLLLGYVRYKTGSIYAGIMTHITMNFTILLMNPLLPQLTSDYVASMRSNSMLYASLVAACIASVALVPMLVVFSSIKPGRRHRAMSVRTFPVGIKYLLGFGILLSTMLFFYFINS